jgi:transposase
MNRTEFSQIEEAMANLENDRLRIRCEAVYLRLDGWTIADTAEELGCSTSAVTTWFGIYSSAGVEGLCKSRKQGRPRILSPEKEQLAKSIIAQSQSALRPARGPDIQFRFATHHIFLSLSTLYETLHRLNFSYQTCRPVHPLNSASEIKAWQAALPGVVKEVQEQNPNRNVKRFFTDEARYGQQGLQCRQWPQVGERPVRERQMEFENAWIYGAACPLTGESRFLVATSIGLDFMELFLSDFSKSLSRGVQAILVMDNAIWLKSLNLKVPKTSRYIFNPLIAQR